MRINDLIPEEDDEDFDALPLDNIVDVGDEIEEDSVSLKDLGLDLSDYYRDTDQ